MLLAIALYYLLAGHFAVSGAMLPTLPSGLDFVQLVHSGPSLDAHLLPPPLQDRFRKWSHYHCRLHGVRLSSYGLLLKASAVVLYLPPKWALDLVFLCPSPVILDLNWPC